MKYLISLLLSINFLNASMLLDSQNTCIEDFYVSAGTFKYLRSDNNTWYSTNTTTFNYGKSVIPNFIYDSAIDKCSPNPAFILGMQETEYNFLLGLMGVIIGGVFMFFLVNAFIFVGGRR